MYLNVYLYKLYVKKIINKIKSDILGSLYL